MTRRQIDLRLAGLELGTLLLTDKLDKRPALARAVRGRIHALREKRAEIEARAAKRKAVRT